jgi:hypothetical protein
VAVRGKNEIPIVGFSKIDFLNPEQFANFVPVPEYAMKEI